MSDVATHNPPVTKLPPQIAAQVARANALVEQLLPQPVAEPVEEPVAEPVAEPIAQEPAPAPVEQPVADPAPINWEHRYKSLDGRYRAMEGRLRDATATISLLQEQVDALSARQFAKTPAEPAAEEDPFTEEEKNEYGADFMAVVAKQARRVSAPLVRELEEKVGQLEQELGRTRSVSQNQGRAQMFAYMDAEIPSWRQVNDNPDFLDWLDLQDPYSGVIRKKYLMDAFEQNDAPRVATFFKGFLTEEAALAPAGQIQQAPLAPVTPAAASVAPAARVSLVSLAAPGRTSMAAAHAPTADKPVYSRAQIAQFYAQVAAGKFRNREQEKVATENLIVEATREGRIV